VASSINIAINQCGIFIITLAVETMFCPNAVCTLDLRNSHQFVSSPTAIVNSLAIKIFTLRAAGWGDIRVFRNFWSITTWCWKKKITSNQFNRIVIWFYKNNWLDSIIMGDPVLNISSSIHGIANGKLLMYGKIRVIFRLEMSSFIYNLACT